MAITINEVQVLNRVVGNREPIGATLQNISGTAINLTGVTVTFRMVNVIDGSVKVNNASATLDDAANGQVSYTPLAADVDTAGTYAAYFTDDSNRRFPYDGAKFLINIIAETDA